MKKKDFFIRALKHKAYTRLWFIIKCFTDFESEPLEEAKKLPYNLIKLNNKYFFYASKKEEYLEIEDSDTAQPLFSMNEELAVSSEDIVNLNSAIKTTYGNLLFNYIVLVHNFNDLIPYQNKHIKIPNIEKIIIDIVSEDEFAKKYTKFAKSIYYLTGISQITNQGHTEKTLLPPTGIIEYRNSLLEEIGTPSLKRA